MVVQKDNQDEATQSENVKELSGGERSYATLALLMALGESIECPFRGKELASKHVRKPTEFQVPSTNN